MLHKGIFARAQLALAVCLLAASAGALAAQAYGDELRLPPRARATLGAWAGSAGAAGASAGIYRDILNPAAGLLGAQLDAYAGGGRHGAEGALALGIRSPILRVGTGVEVDLPRGEAGPFLSLTHPIRRGGIVFPGGMLQLAWVFGGAQRLRLGLQVPVLQPLVGRDRPGSDRVHLTAPRATRPPPQSGDALERAAAELRSRTLEVASVVVPFVGRPAQATPEREIADSLRALAALTATGGAARVLEQYQTALDRAFSVALDVRATGVTPAGRTLADSVRALLLDRVLLPYDRLLGQKRDPNDLAPFAADALAAFGTEGIALGGVVSGGVRAVGRPGAAAAPRRPKDDVARVTWMLGRLLGAMDEVVAGQRTRWGDDRLVWLPLQLGLRDEQHASQTQIDSLLQRITGEAPSDSNHVAYARNSEFQWELYRSIHEAQRYHVLWVHDFKGLTERGRPDSVAFRQLAYGYLDALIKRVRAYDADRLLPEYHIFLDQYYFELDHSRIWMPVLLDPLAGHVSLPRPARAWEATIDSLQAELRRAVAGSRRLQEEARARGQRWLHDRVAVHVHVTNQADASFWSRDILPLVGLSDNALRDHRKLVFYDLADGDPYRGLLIVTGMGVGEQFASPEWEDRAVLVRGPAALAVKRAAATMLERQGLAPERLPAFLRPSTDTVAAAERAPVPRFDLTPATAVQLHNQAGYGEKQATVAKAALYTLMPAGSVLKIPDSLWNNELWASLLVGAALRGGKVLIIAPSVANAPAPQSEPMALAEQTLSRLILASHSLAAPIERGGGLLRVGIYDVATPVEDLPARIDLALATRARNPWLQRLEPYSPAVVDSLRAVAAELRAAGFPPRTARPGPAPSEGGSPRSDIAGGGQHPKLHLKAQFLASADGWTDLFQDPAWGAVLATYFRAQARLVQERLSYLEFRPRPSAAAQAATGGAIFKWQVAREKPEHVVYYLVLGSHNEDYRSALLDGESLLVLSHFGAAIGIEDFTLLPGLCTWVDSVDELHRYVPRAGGRTGWLARKAHILF